MVAPKKRITSELLHIALVITLLRGNPRLLPQDPRLLSTNFFNDVYPDRVLVEGQNWAFSRSSYHHLIDSGFQPVKSLGPTLDFDPLDPDPDEFVLDLDIEEFYRQQSNLLTLSSLNAVNQRKDVIPTFNDITAYLVSDTTADPSRLAPFIPPPITVSSGGGAVTPPTTTRTESESDSGSDSGDESVARGENDLLLTVTVTQDPDLLHHEQEEEEKDGYETDVVMGEEEETQVVPNAAIPPPPASSSLTSLELNEDITVGDVDPTEFLDFLINNGNEPDVEEEPQGAAALPSSLDPEIFPYPGDNGEGSDLMDWTIEEEQAHLDFYRSFNDAANEMMRAVPLREVEGLCSSDSETPATNNNPAAAAAAGAESSSDLPDEPCSGDVTGLDAVIDDLFETDSGVFDFLDSPTEDREATFDFGNLPSIESLESEPLDSEPHLDIDEDEGMIQAQVHGGGNGRPQPRPFPHQVHARMQGLLRGGSMDQHQRWQEIFLNLQQPAHSHMDVGAPHPHYYAGPPFHHSHHHHHHHHPAFPAPSTPYSNSERAVLLQNATLPPPDVASYPGPMGPNLGSAVASSMHLTNSSDPMSDPSSQYKMIEPPHDMIYYPQNATATSSASSSDQMNNQSSAGLFSQILNEDELHIMDNHLGLLAVNEGMHTMTLMDPFRPAVEGATSSSALSQPGPCGVAEDRLEASSDSAVSSMSSERVPPMTEAEEWVDPDHEGSPYSLDYPGKHGYEYYGKDRVAAPVAQKKHQMFGKRFQQEATSGPSPYPLLPPGSHGAYPSLPGPHGLEMDMKYGCGVEFVRHQNEIRGGGLGLEGLHNNHTYALPPTNNHAEAPNLTFKAPKPMAKEKPKKESLSRDEKRARTMQLPITTDDIINLPMDEFNERLSKYDLTEPQLSLIRDIRRRGKNKVAAQNCRKRKLDQIMQLADEVQKIKQRKQKLLREQHELSATRHDLCERYKNLYRHVFQSLRHPETGQPLRTDEYSLQQAADGNIILVPRNGTHPFPSTSSEYRDKSKDPKSE